MNASSTISRVRAAVLAHWRAQGLTLPVQTADELALWLQHGCPAEGELWAALRQALAEAGLRIRQVDVGEASIEGLALRSSPQGVDLWQLSMHEAARCVVGAADGPASLESALSGSIWLLFAVGLPQHQTDHQGYWQWVAQLLRGRVGGLLVSGLLINLGAIILPLFTMLVYDKVMHNGIFETLWALALGVLLFLAVEIMLRWLRARQIERLARVLDERVDTVLFRALLKPAARAGSQPGLTARFMTLYRDLYGARDFFSAHYLLALADLPFVLVIWAVIGVIAWPLLLMVLAWTFTYVLLGSVFKARTLRVSRRASDLQTRKFALLADALSSLDALRTSAVGARFARQFSEISQDHADFQALQRQDMQRQLLLSQVVYVGSYASLLVLGAYLVFDQVVTQGAMVAVGMLSGRTLATVGQSLLTLGRWRELQDALKALQPFLQQEPEAQPMTTGAPSSAVRGELKLLGVGHAYSGAGSALQGITLHIAAGEHVGLLGRPGSGKSTLARVIAQAIVPAEGEVRVDDVALGAWPASQRMRWLSFKPQEATLIAGTLESNILAALPPSTSAEDAQLALKRGVYLSGLDLDFAQGSLSLSQAVEEYGANLSGGQRQKVALARALALPARVLVLDEPSNGLDPESEQLLVKRLSQLTSTTLILVSHSAQLLSLCQRVIALDRGKVVADGPTHELVQVQGGHAGNKKEV